MRRVQVLESQLQKDGKVSLIAEYMWCSGKNTHHDLRSKTRTLTIDAAVVNDREALLKMMPKWNFDGSSTAQARGLNTEIALKPVGVYFHPFPVGDIPTVLVLCECFYTTGEPTDDNTRAIARSVFAKDKTDCQPWFGLEQEYVLLADGRPLGWPKGGFPAPQGDYYCGSGVVAGRKIVDEHYSACLKMGLKIGGTNAEVMPGQWEWQIGPSEGIEAGDHMLLSRWVMLRILENHGPQFDVTYEGRPVPGDWNGTGCHCNFSTRQMRSDGGYDEIIRAVERMKHTVRKDVLFYGAANNERMTGKHETSRYDEFTYGFGTRTTSVRISNSVKTEGKGFFEDRRPGGDIDPYLVTARVFASALGHESAELDRIGERFRKPWMNF